jgi:multicomponent Na+:H+ antiporter subunit F
VTAASWIALAMLIAAAAATVWRAVRPGTIGDRAVALDMIASVIQCGLFVGAVLAADGILVDVALVLGLLGFLSSVTVARFVERTSGTSGTSHG